MKNHSGGTLRPCLQSHLFLFTLHFAPLLSAFIRAFRTSVPPLTPTAMQAEVRRLAAAAGLPNRERPDSQGICFLGKVRFSEFVKTHLGTWPGLLIEEETNAIVGVHEGMWFFTPGQRKGIFLSGGPW